MPNDSLPFFSLSIKMLEQINDFFGRVFSFLQAHPKYGLPVGILLAGIYLLGLIRNWKWTLLPGSSSDWTEHWIELFGEKAVRIGKGVVAVLLIVCLFYLFLKL